jgi:signal transduction histidine kinase
VPVKSLPGWTKAIILAAVYFAAARLGLSMASVHTNVSPVWPPTGIAIAALILLGNRVWPGIMVGAFLANLATGISIATAGGIAAGNTLEALSAAFLLHRYTADQNPLNNTQDFFKFVIFAALSTIVSATIGVLSLCLGGGANWSNYVPLWTTWCLGDLTGALIFAPVVIAWSSPFKRIGSYVQILEAAVLLLLLSSISLNVFGGLFPTGVTNYPLEFLTIPFLIWAALRFGQSGVTVSIVLLSGIAIWGTKNGFGPFIRETPNESLLLLQVFIGTVTVMALVLSAVVTERRQAEEERGLLLVLEQDARIDAEKANQIKDEFLATVSHELRTPLTAMLGWIKLLRDGNLNEETAGKAVEIVERNARAQAKLIEDLLDISRIVSGKLKLDIKMVNLKQVIEDAVEAERPEIENRAIQLRMIFDPVVKPILGDPSRLQQIVWNLLSNAIKFTPEAGRVEIRLERVETHVQIAVSDTGRGIAADILPYVFDRFFQAEGSGTKLRGGLGLGLAVVHHLVELHGGIVQADSPGLEQGATFTVKLPITISETSEEEPQRHKEHKD